ncbi:MAG: iron chelate uptake ABC transporter family permease subunit, partial [Acidilobaceae archaeon]
MIIQKAPFFRLFALLLILSAVFVLALSIGPGGFVNPLWFNNETEAGILRYRLLRVSAGVLVGTALGVAGLCIQRVTRNPLADPYLIGI